jgi:hypothetical protein
VVFDRRAPGRQVDYLTKLTPGTVIHSFGWSGNGVLVVGYEQERAAKSAASSTAGRSRASSSRRRADALAPRARARVPDGRAARGHSRQRSRDTSWPLTVHPSLPGAVLHWMPDDPSTC